LFDILYIDGRNLQSLSFLERWRNLSNVIIQTNNNNNIMRISDFIDVRGIDIFQRIKSMNLEALLKRTHTVKIYTRSKPPNWLKIKNLKSQDCVVIGYTREKE
jgi:bifunctional non-homologous end joining protein LigD